jgi:hypothetical protein
VTDAPGKNLTGPMLKIAHAFDVEAVKKRLSEAGGYEELSLLVTFARTPARAS